MLRYYTFSNLEISILKWHNKNKENRKSLNIIIVPIIIIYRLKKLLKISIILFFIFKCADTEVRTLFQMTWLYMICSDLDIYHWHGIRTRNILIRNVEYISLTYTYPRDCQQIKGKEQAFCSIYTHISCLIKR